MAQTVITVGKSRDFSFIPLDQWGHPNPVDPATGKPLWPQSATWSLGDLVGRTEPFQLTPSADTFVCDVEALIAGVTLVLHCHAKLEDGTVVHGATIIESIAASVEPPTPPVIASLQLQAGPEKSKTRRAAAPASPPAMTPAPLLGLAQQT